MAEAGAIWRESLPIVRDQVTGVGVWTALNCAVPIAIEDDVLVLGLGPRDMELSGHLKMAQTKRLIETDLAKRLGRPISVRVIDGVTPADWERAKRRDAEAQRLREIADNKARAEMTARSSWDGIYEQLSRRYAAIPNKSLPQNRAKFLREGITLLAEALKEQTNKDDLSERNFGRCIERISQYSEVPSTLVAAMVLEKAGIE